MQPRKKKQSLAAWKLLEKDEKFPKCVKSLLIAAGYDTLSSMNALSDEKIHEIEHFHTENKQFIVKLNCCYDQHYKRLEVFAFLPGHRTTILGLPARIAQMKMQNMNNTPVNTPKDRTAAVSKISVKKSLPDMELQTNLIENLMKYSGKMGFQFPAGMISDANIRDFVRGSDEDNFVCKCKFSCPFCAKTFRLAYKEFWMSSNVTHHLKMHHVNIETAFAEKNEDFIE